MESITSTKLIIKSERKGFEPLLKLPLNSISNAAPSTTRPPLHKIYLFIINKSSI